MCLLATSTALSAQQSTIDTLYFAPVLIMESSHAEVYAVDSIPQLVLEESVDLVQALRNATHLYIREYGVGNIANVTLRGGSAQQTALFWNGLPINSPSLGLADLSLIPAIFLDEVSIHSGAASQLTGTGGLSGSMLLSSGNRTEGRKLKFHQTLSPTLGSFGSDLMISTRNGDWTSRTAIHSLVAANNFEYKDESGPELISRRRENAATSSKGVSQDIGIALGSAHSISMHGYLIDTSREIPSNLGIPNREEQQDDKVGRLALSYVRSKEHLQQIITLGGSDEWQLFQSPQSELIAEVKTKTRNLRLSNSYAVDEQSLINFRLSLDRLSLALDGAKAKHSNLAGAYVEIDHSSENGLKLNMGAGIEQLDGRSSPVAMTIGVGHTIRAIKGLSVKGSLGSNYRFPTLNDKYWPSLGNPNLKTERSYSSDASIHLKRAAYSGNLGVFYSHFSRLIVWLPSADGRFRPVNLTESYNTGLELTLSARPSQRIDASASFAYTDSQVKRDSGEEDQPSIYQPAYTAFSTLKYKFDQWRLGLSYNYSSSVRTDYASNPSRLDPIHVLDFNYRWTPKAIPQLKLGIDINNILNHNYQYVAQRPTAGRVVQFHLILKIHEKN